jgi:DNA-binding NarL/FixJ family response regulator
MTRIRVLLADDHVLMRAGIRALLEEMPGVQVVAEVGNGLEALAAMKEHRPDVALVDIAMPGLNGLDVTTKAAQELPQVRIIILSMHATSAYVRRALQAGAKGYLRKDADPDELKRAVQSAFRGELFLNHSVSEMVVSSYVKGSQSEDRSLESLTPRQQEVLQFLGEGLSTKDIAGKLQVSSRTIESYRAQLMKRLEIHDLAGLIRYAIRMGLVSTDE